VVHDSLAPTRSIFHQLKYRTFICAAAVEGCAKEMAGVRIESNTFRIASIVAPLEVVDDAVMPRPPFWMRDELEYRSEAGTSANDGHAVESPVARGQIER